MRARSTVAARNRHKKIKSQTKGMGHSRRASYKLGKQAVIKSQQYQYRDRRNKKRDFRRLWITRINAAARENELSYSQFMNGLTKAGVEIDRKILAELAVNEPKAFSDLAGLAKK